MDPLTLGTLIITAIIGSLTLILNIYQSIRFDHFKLNCSDCCSISMDNEPDECEKK